MYKERLIQLPGLILLVLFLAGADAGRGQMNPASGPLASVTLAPPNSNPKDSTPAPAARFFRVLVVASRARDHLKMIAAARPFFENMAAANHFDLDFTDDTSQINPGNLRRYQVFVMLHLAPFDMSPSQQAALQQFAEEGKGWVGIHAAGLTGREFLAPTSQYWQWFENFMGGVTYSPHPAFQQATLIIEDTLHPATRHLPASVNWPDEWYEFNKSPRDRVHVLARVDESTYHPNKPMGDHPIIWTNERYRRMIFIGPGHDPVLLQDPTYAALLRNAILWAASGDPLPPITMKDGIVDYEQHYDLPGVSSAAASFRQIHDAIVHSPLLTIKTTDPQTGILSGTGLFKVITGEPAPFYWMRFDWTVTVTADQYSVQTVHYYEKPIGPGVSNEYSKIEYRWWDFRQGHPWSTGDRRLFDGIDSTTRGILNQLSIRLNATVSPRFKVLALYENGGHHVEYSTRARTWLTQLAADSNFKIDYLTHTDSITDDLLSQYRLIIQLDYAPYAWKPTAMTAFQKYIEEGRGGWIGFHHATLLGEFDGYPIWPWFSNFMGGIRWKDYIFRFAKATVHVEDPASPVMKGIPDSFVVQKEEWYTYDKSPRPNVHVLASVDESSYQPDTSIKMGDHPVIWTNEKMGARNVYIFMGHSPILFDDWVYQKIFSNAIFWAAATSQPATPQPATPDLATTTTAAPPATASPKAATATHGAKQTPALTPAPKPKFKALAFYSHTVEPDHIAFARDAINFYTALAARKDFSFDTTSDWAAGSEKLNDYQLILWLNDFPHTEEERSAFARYMDGGGAWLGFHVSAYNDRDTRWPWFVHFLGDAVFYNNSWPPLPARLIVEDQKHPATRRLPARYTAPINEWYGWRPNPRLDKDVHVLISLDTANYPLGKKDILRSGDIPVVWTNTKYKMLYMNMGHGDLVLSSPLQNRLFEDAILWLSSNAATPAAAPAHGATHPTQ
ncbi:MAG TPA: ThuA domain-containing protein [Puia sp.]|jgi:hypothetical protein|nr:ThuA domain-containing protein [Puia sp.]